MPRLRYIGHATVEIELDGVRVLTDPLLRNRVAHLRRAAPVDARTLLQPDLVLISHAHLDHLDRASLAFVSGARMVAPRGVAATLSGYHVEEVEPGDELEAGPLLVRATHAEHEGGRPPRREGPALGYAILGSRRVFFAGDTDLFDGMDGLVPDLDVALLPIWGWGATLGRGKHMDPVRAAEAVRRLRPKLVVPIHWGTYRPLHRSRHAEFLRLPALAFERAVHDARLDTEVRVLEPGAVLDGW
ncbi:MAG: MBL fold metallo-hydrolase [Myxococcales bacterium]|jgi:L-ascorbate metabolism protein UlaG (beta-lactamase superfamily)